jgi:hypothetical protein
MCFKIAKEHVVWTTTKVYKVMSNNGPYLSSPYYPNGKQYQVGDILECDSDEYVDIVFITFWQKFNKAKAGIYVLDTREFAINYLNSVREFGQVMAVLECEVDPKDFLYHDVQGSMATYKKVKFLSILYASNRSLD